jgi:hypothetical protein
MLSLCCGLLKWLVKLDYLCVAFCISIGVWCFSNIYLQEGWWLETFSRCIYFCYNWSFASVWCYFSFNSCHQALDGKCNSLHCVDFSNSYLCTCCLSSMSL